MTTMSPLLWVLTSGPTSVTSPVVSWPMMKPVLEGWWPRKTWSSLMWTIVQPRDGVLGKDLPATQRAIPDFDNDIRWVNDLGHWAVFEPDVQLAMKDHCLHFIFRHLFLRTRNILPKTKQSNMAKEFPSR